ncbi:MAG: serine/threonine-protein kinase [Acidobacteriota bacterium]
MTTKMGTRLGPYEIVASIGAGGMGEVYRARDIRLGRPVAIKVLPESLATERKAQARFEREALAVGSLNHPNIVTLYDIGTTPDGVPYSVIELLEGESLATRLTEGPVPDWREVVEIGIAVAAGLSAAHDSGIIHRDVKPSNVFLTRDGQVKILDFGVARLEPTLNRSTTDSDLPTQTAAGQVVGTLAYMAPEQLNGGKIDARSDLFSLGCVLYELLTGTHPFERDSFVNTIMSVVQEEPPSLALARTEHPPELGDTVMRCLAKNPTDRWESAQHLVAELSQLAGSAVLPSTSWPEEDRTPPEPPPAKQPTHKWALLGAGLALVVVFVAAMFWTQQGASSQSRVGVFSLTDNRPGETGNLVVGQMLDTFLQDTLAEVDVDPVLADDTIEACRIDVTAPPMGESTARCVGERLGVDYLLIGSYLVGGDTGSERVRVDLVLQATEDGRVVERVSHTGIPSELMPELANGVRDALTASGTE